MKKLIEKLKQDAVILAANYDIELTPEILTSGNRTEKFVMVRNACIILLLKDYKPFWNEIANEFRKNRTTLYHTQSYHDANHAVNFYPKDSDVGYRTFYDELEKLFDINTEHLRKKAEVKKKQKMLNLTSINGEQLTSELVQAGKDMSKNQEVANKAINKYYDSVDKYNALLLLIKKETKHIINSKIKS